MVAQRALFDTNILIDYLNGIPQARDVLVEYHINPAISAITWMEVMVGDKKTGSGAGAENTSVFRAISVLPITDEVAERAVELRHSQHVKLPDAIIWATAQVGFRMLISRNPKDFGTDNGVLMPYRL
ncbi:TPA: type II toxin-antitoxin system VapC family toxin [Serratia marcescens]